MEIQPATAEFMEGKSASAHFGLSIRTLYRLDKAKLIQSRIVRRPGNISGKRLFVTASIREYLTGLVQ